MKKYYLKPLFLATLFTFISANIYAQDDLKNSKYSKQILEYLSVNEYEVSKTGAPDFYIDSEYLSKKTQITHIYIGQQYQGIEVFNATSSFAIKDDKVFYVGNSFIPNVKDIVNTSSPAISQLQAINNVASRFNLDQIQNLILVKSEKNEYVYDKGDLFLENIPVKLVYVYSNDLLKLAWDLSLYTLDGKHNWSARVDALTGEIIESNDYVISCDFGTPGIHEHSGDKENHFVEEDSKFELFKKSNTTMVGGAEYRVWPLPVESPNHGGRQLVVDPENILASPYGWHDTNGAPGAEYTITRGNNTHTYNDQDNNNGSTGDEPDGGASLSFDYTSNLGFDPSSDGFFQNLSSNTTNLFYVTNMVHDILYAYGFDEAAGNFQFNNYGNGGLGDDHVLAEAQDGSGTNNANFSTPIDGGNGRMQMYLWSSSGGTDLDGDLDNGIVVHEYGHGISTRLAGGPNNSSCLAGDEQQGEGWSDWFTLMLTMEPGDVDTDGRGIGTFAADQAIDGGGIRTYRYSTNMSINPHTYDDIKTEAVPHGVGSVWAAMLWDLTWAYIDKYGVDADLYNGTGGNNKVMQLVLDGLKLQPCGSGFVDSRDAILAADIALTGGADQCLIWEVFANRGLGASADQGTSGSSTDGTEAFDMPSALITASVVTNDTCGTSDVSLNFANYDTNAISQFDYDYTVDGGVSTSGSYSNSIGSCSISSAVSFDYGILPFGTHEIVITGTNPVTTPTTFLVHSNGTQSYDVINTFETPADDFVTFNEGNKSSTWERGAAAGVVLSAAVANNSTVYGTNLDGIHGDASIFYLVSRCYDLSNLINTSVNFDLAFDIERNWDLIYLEYSTDGGATWSVLGDSTDPDWYNSSRTPNGIDCFNCIGKQWTGLGDEISTHSAGGVNSTLHAYSYPLSAFDNTGSAEESFVFRFLYQADALVANEGAIIDNFVVEGESILSVDDLDIIANSIRVYPNPNTGIFKLKKIQNINLTTASIHDINGRFIKQIDLSNMHVEKQIDIADFASGIYFMTVASLESNTVIKLVKE